MIDQINLTKTDGTVFCELKTGEYPDLLDVTWKGFVEHEHVKQGVNEIMRLMQAHGFAYILNDIKQVEGSWDHSNEWLADVWMPKSVELGLKQLVFVTAGEFFSEISMRFFAENAIKHRHPLKIADSREEAMQIINEQREARDGV